MRFRVVGYHHRLGPVTAIDMVGFLTSYSGTCRHAPCLRTCRGFETRQGSTVVLTAF